MENIEKQIVRIIENNSPELAAEEILCLFSVVGRSEQFTFEDMRNAFDAGAWEHHIHDFDSWIKTQK